MTSGRCDETSFSRHSTIVAHLQWGVAAWTWSIVRAYPNIFLKIWFHFRWKSMRRCFVNLTLSNILGSYYIMLISSPHCLQRRCDNNAQNFKRFSFFVKCANACTRLLVITLYGILMLMILMVKVAIDETSNESNR